MACAGRLLGSRWFSGQEFATKQPLNDPVTPFCPMEPGSLPTLAPLPGWRSQAGGRSFRTVALLQDPGPGSTGA